MTFKNEYISYSRLNLFRRCPRQFKRVYIEGVRGASGFAADFGKALHAALEGGVRVAVMFGAEVVDRDTLLGFWATACAKYGFTAVDAAEGVDILERWRKAERVGDVLGIEKKFKVKVGPYQLYGFIDRVDAEGDVVVIRDYKSNRKLFSKSELKHSLQLHAYAIAAETYWPGRPVRLVYDMLRHGIQQVAPTPTPDELEWSRVQIQALAKASEESETYPGRLNEWCVYCHLRSECPEFNAAANADVVLPEALGTAALIEAKAAADAVLKTVKSRKHDIDRQLKSRIENDGDIPGDGGTWTLYESKKPQWPDVNAALVALLALLPGDITAPNLLTFDKKAFDAWIKELTKAKPGLAARIKAEVYARANVTSSFRLWFKKGAPAAAKVTRAVSVDTMMAVAGFKKKAEVVSVTYTGPARDPFK